MKKLFLLFLVAAMSGLQAMALSTTNYASNDYISAWGPLKLVATPTSGDNKVQLADKNGVAVQLRGWSTHGYQWASVRSFFDQQNDFQGMKNLGANVVRLTCYVSATADDVSASAWTETKAWVKNAITWCAELGLYAIVDYHVLTPGNPNNYLTGSAREFPTTFFADISSYVKQNGYNHVLYEICNEPNSIDWASIKTYANQILPVIAANDPHAVVIVGTPGFSRTLSDANNNKITHSTLQIMYAFHYFACSDADAALLGSQFTDNMLKNIPVIVTEWNDTPARGLGAITGTPPSANATSFINRCNGTSQKVSWTAWSWSPVEWESGAERTSSTWKSGTSGSGSVYTTANLSPTGIMVYNELQKNHVNYGPPAAPAPTTFFPANGADNIPIDTRLYAVFNKDITVNTNNNTNNVSIDEGGTIVDVTASNDTLYISATLVKAKTYTITAGAGTVKDAGDNLSEAFSWSFTTDSLGPILASRAPEGATGAPIKQIKLVFNEAIQKVSGQDIKVNGGSVGYTLVDNTITLKDTVIKPLRTYTVFIPKEVITDMSGNELAADIEWTFTTKDDAIVFPYLPVLDEDYLTPSWMSGKAYSPNQEVRGCAADKSTTGVFNTSTINVGNKANGNCYVIMDLPKCGVIKFRSSYTSKRASTIIKVVDGVETTLLSREWDAANSCNYDSFDVNEFGPVTVKISASTTSGGGDIYALEIYAPTNSIAFTWVGATTAKSFDVTANNGKDFTVDWGNGSASSHTGTGSKQTVTQAAAYGDTNSYTVIISTTDPDCSFTELHVDNKSLTALDVSHATALTGLSLLGNKITALDISHNTELNTLECEGNLLTALDISKNTQLTWLSMGNNRLSLSSLYALSTQLSTTANKQFGTQLTDTLDVSAGVPTTITTETQFGTPPATTTYANVKRNGVAATGQDYTLAGNQITFLNGGLYTLEAGNDSTQSVSGSVLHAYRIVSFHVKNEAEMKMALTYFNDPSNTEDIPIVVKNDITLTSPITISGSTGGKTLTIKSDEGTTATLRRGVTGNLCTVAAGASLTLVNIAIDGNKESYPEAGGSLLEVEGALTVGGTTVLKNNTLAVGFASNVHLADGVYITLGTGANAPAAGMEVWVNTATADGVFVNSDTEAASHIQYFHSDVSGKTVQMDGDKLAIVDLPDDPDPSTDPDPVITYYTVALTTGTGIVIDKDKKSFQIQSGNPFSFVITLAEGYEGLTPTVTVNGRNKGLISIGTDKWRCILSEVSEDTDVLVSLNLTGNEQPDALQLYSRGGQLYINTPTGTPCAIYNVTGQVVANRQLAPGLTTIPLPAGIYIVRLDGLTRQVIVNNK